MRKQLSQVADGVYRFEEACNVYVVVPEPGPEAGPAAPRAGGVLERRALAIDFGTGAVLDHLDEIGVDRITDILMTHHHRDQGQGLARAAAAGIRVHVPPVEQDLFAEADEFWRTRPLYNDYVLRQDRFSLLESVPDVVLVPEYRTASYAGIEVEVIPTPGHTTGSVSYLIHRAGALVAFTGDLIYAPGKVWSLASTQWSYNENEGPEMTVLSCYQLLQHELSLLLPSHGQVMTEPGAALDLLARQMTEYVDSRRPWPRDVRHHLDHPYVNLSPHLLHNRSSHSISYVLVSETGAAVVFDYGYDMTTGLPGGTDRAARRPWLASLPALRREHGVTTIDVALPTHYHDDHVAGMNLLRDVEGTQVWAPENMSRILEHPLELDLPCTWFDPIPVDRVLPLGETFTWHEYEITVHELRGHTAYAVAYEFVVDGLRVLVTGDQQDGNGEVEGRREYLNYQYRNGFGIEDFQDSAALYRKLAPDLMISGHWSPRWVDEDYLAMLEHAGEEVRHIHEQLLPLDELDLGAGGVTARIEPYFSRVHSGASTTFRVVVRNPFPDEQPATLRLVTPVGWRAQPEVTEVRLPARGSIEVEMEAVVNGPAERRRRVAVDLTIGEHAFGHHTEALVDVIAPAPH